MPNNIERNVNEIRESNPENQVNQEQERYYPQALELADLFIEMYSKEEQYLGTEEAKQKFQTMVEHYTYLETEKDHLPEDVTGLMNDIEESVMEDTPIKNAIRERFQAELQEWTVTKQCRIISDGMEAQLNSITAENLGQLNDNEVNQKIREAAELVVLCRNAVNQQNVTREFQDYVNQLNQRLSEGDKYYQRIEQAAQEMQQLMEQNADEVQNEEIQAEEQIEHQAEEQIEHQAEQQAEEQIEQHVEPEQNNELARNNNLGEQNVQQEEPKVEFKPKDPNEDKISMQKNRFQELVNRFQDRNYEAAEADDAEPKEENDLEQDDPDLGLNAEVSKEDLIFERYFKLVSDLNDYLERLEKVTENDLGKRDVRKDVNMAANLFTRLKSEQIRGVLPEALGVAFEAMENEMKLNSPGHKKVVEAIQLRQTVAEKNINFLKGENDPRSKITMYRENMILDACEEIFLEIEKNEPGLTRLRDEWKQKAQDPGQFKQYCEEFELDALSEQELEHLAATELSNELVAGSSDIEQVPQERKNLFREANAIPHLSRQTQNIRRVHSQLKAIRGMKGSPDSAEFTEMMDALEACKKSDDIGLKADAMEKVRAYIRKSEDPFAGRSKSGKLRAALAKEAKKVLDTPEVQEELRKRGELLKEAKLKENEVKGNARRKVSFKDLVAKEEKESGKKAEKKAVSKVMKKTKTKKIEDPEMKH